MRDDRYRSILRAQTGRVRWPLSVRVSDAGAAQAVEEGKDRAPASESLRRTNPRDGGEDLVVYGELIARGHWLEMVLRVGESRERLMIAGRALPA